MCVCGSETVANHLHLPSLSLSLFSFPCTLRLQAGSVSQSTCSCCRTPPGQNRLTVLLLALSQSGRHTCKTHCLPLVCPDFPAFSSPSLPCSVLLIESERLVAQVKQEENTRSLLSCPHLIDFKSRLVAPIRCDPSTSIVIASALSLMRDNFTGRRFLFH